MIVSFSAENIQFGKRNKNEKLPMLHYNEKLNIFIGSYFEYKDI